MEFSYNLAQASTSIAMIGAVISFVGVGLLILIFSERLFHGLSKLFYFFGNQILISRKLFSLKYIEEKKASNNKLFTNEANITREEATLTERKEWLEKILKMKV